VDSSRRGFLVQHARHRAASDFFRIFSAMIFPISSFCQLIVAALTALSDAGRTC